MKPPRSVSVGATRPGLSLDLPDPVIVGAASPSIAGEDDPAEAEGGSLSLVPNLPVEVTCVLGGGTPGLTARKAGLDASDKGEWKVGAQEGIYLREEDLKDTRRKSHLFCRHIPLSLPPSCSCPSSVLSSLKQHLYHLFLLLYLSLPIPPPPSSPFFLVPILKLLSLTSSSPFSSSPSSYFSFPSSLIFLL